MENAAWDIESAKTGVVHSFLQPLDHRIPDGGYRRHRPDCSFGLLSETWKGVRVVELEGPERYSANDVAAALADVLGNPVRNEIVPRASWEELFRSQGMKNPLPRIKRMVDGFNEGWIDFEAGPEGTKKGTTTLTSALRSLGREMRPISTARSAFPDASASGRRREP